jgi:hypothetical protein
MSAIKAEALPEGQKEALGALRSLANVSDGALTVDLDYLELNDGALMVRIYLSVASLLSSEGDVESSEGDVELEDWEPIDVIILKDFP